MTATVQKSPAVTPVYRIPPVRWGLPTAAGFVVGFMAVILLLVAGVPLLALPADVSDIVVWIVGYGLLLAGLMVLTRTRGTGTWANDFGLRFRWFDIFTGLGSGIGCQIVGGMVAVMLVLLVGGTSRGNTAAEAENGVFLVLNGFVAVVLVAPFAEELLFRGLVLRSIRHSMLRRSADPSRSLRVWAAITAVGVSAILFAAMHLREGWGSPATMAALGAQTLVLGIVNGVFAVTTGRLWPGILTHMTFNLYAAVLAALAAHSG
ncbi:type II CAAX endopeptidase family protein [Microbacterium sp. 1P10UB]|uniref:CPBP family intramembrane glutamic endopeptidase n=1 Tax=unclassified Microbacterium TaxID=2609290 RepID=UPI0039A2DCDC